jgi:general stress protein 26
MANQKKAEGADLWFGTTDDTAKIADLEHDPHLNLAYFKPKSMEWISASGTPLIARDRKKMGELYAEDWKMWFASEGDPRLKTPDDPRMVLIGV